MSPELPNLTFPLFFFTYSCVLVIDINQRFLLSGSRIQINAVNSNVLISKHTDNRNIYVAVRNCGTFVTPLEFLSVDLRRQLKKKNSNLRTFKF